MTMLTLTIVQGFGAGSVVELGEAVVTIGRDPSNTVQIGDPKASRTHVELRPTASGWELVDLGSSNGTWNDAGKVDRVALSDGDSFRIGRTYFRFAREGFDDDLAGTLVGDDGDWVDPSSITGLDGGSRLLEPGADADDVGQAADDSLARHNRYLALLHQVVVRCASASNREALFELLDDIAADALELDRCAVFLPTDDGWELWPPHERRLKARFGATPFARGLLGAARARLEPLLCTNEGDLAPTMSMVSAGVAAAMVAPVQVGEHLHGLLYVDRLDGDGGYTREDLEFLAAVGNQLAVRLHDRAVVGKLEAEVERLSAAQEPEAKDATLALIGDDAAMTGVRQLVGKVGPTEAPVLILGESGTGKELVARAVHAASKRAGAPLQVVNCAALAESLVESTLFGHVKGAFTGADDTRPGLFERADGATLFLDELGELPLAIQAKLLRALEQGEVQRLGDSVVRTVDVRVIAATNRDLASEAAAGSFREDLYHRLSVLEITLPPLRERPGDIDRLTDHFLGQVAGQIGGDVPSLEPAAKTALLRCAWPGNVRQLRNTIERAAILCSDGLIRVADLPEAVRGSQPSAFSSPVISLAEIERMHIQRVLDHTGGNKKAAAELLGIDRSTLYAKLRQYQAQGV